MTQYRYKVCPICTVKYALDVDFARFRQEAPSTSPDRHWFCPNGHQLVYTESLYDKERRRRRFTERDLTRANQQLDSANRSAAAYKGHFNRLSRKAREGACPVCDERFPELTAHMQEQHPEWEGPEVGDPTEHDEQSEEATAA